NPLKSDDFAHLPPLPAPIATARAAPAAPPVEEGYSTLPPLPPPTSASEPRPVRVIPAAPNLKFTCFTPNDPTGAGPCTDFVGDTVLTVSAAQDVAAGISLEFVRNGHSQADVDLGGLKSGRP